MEHDQVTGVHSSVGGVWCETKRGQAWHLLRSKCLRPFYDLTIDKEANDCVCVLAKARVHVGSGPD